MVDFAETMTSPSISSTSRNTPCVLGCCGPMLTVIVSVRSSGMLSHSARRPLLQSSSTNSQITCSNVRCTSWARAVDGRARSGECPPFVRLRLRRVPSTRSSSAPCLARPERFDHVRRSAARRDPERDVAGLAQRLDLPGEHAVVRVVVADRRQDARVGRQRNGRESRAVRAETARRTPPRSAARRPRFLRCRTPARVRRDRRPSAIASIARNSAP